MTENLNNGVPPNSKILSFTAKVPEAKEGNSLSCIKCF